MNGATQALSIQLPPWRNGARLGCLRRGLYSGVLAWILGVTGCVTRPPAPDAVVTGVALSRERVMLPPEAVFEATLLDVTQPDQPPVVLGRQRRQPAGQPPYALWIPYPSARFVPKGRYEVRTTVTLEGRLLLASDRRYSVPQDAAYRHVDVQMQRLLPLAATVEASVPLLLTHWRLVEMAGEALSRPADGVSVPHLVFQADEPRVAGSGGCNRFLADYELQPQSGHLRMGQLVSNISLCLQSSGLETQYFEALLAVRGFRQVGTQLLLRGAEGEQLLRFEAVETLPG
ncbi:MULTISPECIES: META domain-containing protein [unclassified Acidovorax]|uniref:META domain-containing protein n=1 Tax=unclassified Acidovorax TaxID=2684926 RepID=UPI001E325248|nr:MULTISPECIES: META domain-containing protein [unclassified Acidovorax]